MTTAFYHVAGIYHWREIVTEQLRCLGAAKFTGTLHVHFSGLREQQWFIQRVADLWQIPIEFHPENRPLDHHEYPAIAWAQDYAHTHLDENILYFHCKGVSCPGSWNHTLWRWMMNSFMLTQWEKSELILTELGDSYDWVAPQIFGPNIPHSSGNFWLARATHLAKLENLERFHRNFPTRYAGRMPWMWTQRHANEAWIGSDDRYPANCRQLLHIPVDMWNAGSWIRHVNAQTYATQHGS